MPNARMLKNSPKKRTCCGVVEEARERRVNRKNGQPWVVIKLMVVFTVGIMAYAAYVYIARLCVKMIHRRNGAGGSRGAGIALLSVFLVLYLWMLWAYAKVVLTPPGYAKDHVPKQPRPSFPEQIRPASWNTLDHRVEYGSPDQQHRARPSFSTVQPDLQRIDSIAGPSYESIPMRPNASAVGRTDQTPRQVNDLDTPNDIEVGVLDTFPSSTSRQGRGEKSNSALSEDRWKKKKDSKRTRALEKERPRVHVDRRPPTVPILLPEHRYCGLDEIVKPYRTHHCRTCGTCVLKYDHHCPWIGQCVGARNHKFFVNFVQAALMFTSYTFATLLTYIIRKASARGGSVDPQEIVILVLAAIFILFTGLLLVTHIQLIWVGQTTVESMQARALHGQESMALADVLGRCQILEKRRIRRRWDEEWGTIEKEGNIWWLGSGMKGWVDVMGINRWGWIFPIGRSQSDGLVYLVNPRFDVQGRWRRRRDWPAELR